LATKTATKKAVPQKSAKLIRDFDEAQKLLRDLELDLRKLKIKLNGLCHDPHIAGPK
jgi:hypothetical protein